jgi:hypothetical protein
MDSPEYAPMTLDHSPLPHTASWTSGNVAANASDRAVILVLDILGIAVVNYYPA